MKKFITGLLGAMLCLSLVASALVEGESEAAEPNSASEAGGVPAFVDIDGHWAGESIRNAVASGWFQGTGANMFSPDADVTRGMFVTILGHMAADGDGHSAGAGSFEGASQSVFADVAADAYYAPYAVWANAQGIAGGVSATAFDPERSITREEMAVMLNQYARWDNARLSAGASPVFPDSSAISEWARESVMALAAAGVISGKSSGAFDPKGTASRAEAAAMLTRYAEKTGGEAPEMPDEPQASAAVFLTRDISSKGLMAVYEALGRTPVGNVAVKLSTGEAGNTHYLDPNLIKELVQLVDGTIVECNTAYGGSRASTAMHRQVAEDHGFTAVADVDIMDAEGSMELPVEGGVHLTSNRVGSHFANYDSFLVLSHFKGHAMGGFGGAIKNISIGIASSSGKNLIHTAGASDTSFMGGDQDSFLESMAEAAKSVSDRLNHGENIMYINVMNHLSVDCDCDGNPAEPDMHDIGILASADPVALDQACVDLVYAAADGASLIERMESRNGIHTLEWAAEIGLGSRTYELITIDD